MGSMYYTSKLLSECHNHKAEKFRPKSCNFSHQVAIWVPWYQIWKVWFQKFLFWPPGSQKNTISAFNSYISILAQLTDEMDPMYYTSKLRFQCLVSESTKKLVWLGSETYYAQLKYWLAGCWIVGKNPRWPEASDSGWLENRPGLV